MPQPRKLGLYVTFEQGLIINDLLSRCIDRLQDDALDDLARREYMELKDIVRTSLNKALKH